MRNQFRIVAVWVACLVPAILPLSAAETAGRQMTPMDVARLQAVADAELSPDGKMTAYLLSVPRIPGKDEDGAAWQELHIFDVSGRTDRPFITGKVNIGSISWAPDSSGIYFLSRRTGDEHTSLYFIPADGGEARRKVVLDSDIAAYDISADGAMAALIAGPPKDKDRQEREKEGFRQVVVEEDWASPELLICDFREAGSAPRKIGIAGSVRAVQWNPAGRSLAVSVTPTPSVDDSYMSQRIRVIDSGTGELLQEIANPGKLGTFKWSPNGRLLAMISAADLHDPAAGRLLLARLGSSELENPLPDLEADVAAFEWRDSEEIVYLEARGVRTSVRRLSLTSGQSQPVISGDGPVFSSLSLSQDGSAALTGSTPSHPPELFLTGPAGSNPERVTDSNPWLSEVALAPQEVVRFKARDGLELEGILIRPLGEQSGRRYPLILSVHGGPEAHETNGWLTNYSRPGQVAAARGMAVFYPNYRGSTGRGVAFSKLSQGDPAGREFDDLVDAVDHLIEAGLADRDKVGITGGSYGGYATAWSTTRYSDRFAAGVMFVGISNKISKVGTTDIPEEEFLVHALKRPWDDWEFFLERSPVFHAGKSRTPLLILHGTDDPRVNVGQSRELYRHLKLRGEAPVRLVFYPGEQHGNRKAAARYDYSLRMLRWFEHYLKGPGGEPPDYALDYQLDDR